MAISLNYNQQTDVQPGMTPADAQGARMTPAVGEALESLGNQGSRLTADYARIEYMRQHANDVTQLQNNITQGTEDFDKIGDDLKQEVGPSGVGYADRLMQKFHPWAQQVLEQQKNPQVQQMAARQLKTMELGLFREARNYEANTTRAWRVGSFENSINSEAELVGKDPTLFEPLMNEKLQALGQIQGLHPMDSFNLANKVKSTYSEAAMLSDAQNRPQWTVNMLRGTQPLPEGSIQQKIVDYANQKNVPPQAALAFAQFESAGMNPNAVNGKSVGLYQLQPDTAAQYGVADRLNPDQNLKGGIDFMADNAKAFKSTFKRDPTLPEWYSMHLFGLGGGMAFTKAPDNEPFIDFANKVFIDKSGKPYGDQVQMQNHFQNMTVGQVRQQLAGWMQKASNETAGYANAPAANEAPNTDEMPPYFRMATPQQRQAIETHAQNNMRKDDSVGKMMLEGTISAHYDAFAHGVSPGQLLTLKDFTPFGKAGVYKYQQYLQQQNYGSQLSQVKQMPLEQLPSFVESMRPTGDSTAQQWRNFDTMTREVIPQMLQQRKDAPMDYAATNGGYDIKELDFSNPETIPEQIRVRAGIASQVSKDYGTPLTMFLGNEKSKMSQFFQSATSPQIAGTLKQLHSGSPDPQSYMAMLSPIATDAPVVAGVGAIMDKQNPIQMPGRHFWNANSTMAQEDVGSTMLDGWRAMNPPKSEGKPRGLPIPKEGDMAQEFAKVVGNTFGTDARSYDTALQMARSYYVGAGLKDGSLNEVLDNSKMDQAIRAATGGIVNYNSRGNIALPWGMRESSFNDTVAQKFPQAITAAGLDPRDYPAAAYGLTNFKDNVYMVTSGSAPLKGPNGPVLINLNESDPLPPPPSALDEGMINRGRKTYMLTLKGRPR